MFLGVESIPSREAFGCLGLCCGPFPVNSGKLTGLISDPGT